MMLATYMRHPAATDNVSEPDSLSSQWRKAGVSRGTWEHLHLDAQRLML